MSPYVELRFDEKRSMCLREIKMKKKEERTLKYLITKCEEIFLLINYARPGSRPLSNETLFRIIIILNKKNRLGAVNNLKFALIRSKIRANDFFSQSTRE